MVKKTRDFLRIRHAKSHDSGALKNPLFVKVQRSKASKVVIGLVISLFAVAGVIGATYIPVFELNNIDVSGNTTLSEDVIRATVYNTFTTHKLPFINALFIYGTSTQALREALLHDFSFQSVDVERSSSRSIYVRVVEKPTTIALRTKDATVMLDTQGAYVRDATWEESRAIDLRIGTATPEEEEVIFPLLSTMPIVINTENESLAELPLQTASLLLSLFQRLPTESGVHVLSCEIQGVRSPFVRISSSDSYDIFFDIQGDSLDKQIAALNAVLNAPGFIAPQEYLDLRFGAYVYKK